METQTKTPNPAKKLIIRAVLITAAGIGIWYGISSFNYARHHESTDNAQIETNMVSVLPRLAGYVKSVAVKDYDLVKKGQLLVEIDEAEYQLALDEMQAIYVQAEADIANAKANVVNAQLSLKSAVTNGELVKIKRDKAKQDLDRDTRLYNDKAITQKQYDDTRTNYATLETQYVAALNEVAVAKSRIDILKSTLQKADAQLNVQKSRIEQQKLKLSYAKVYAPETGRIGKKNIQSGQFIQPGQPLFTIVSDSTFWIVANFKESQIENIKEGDDVEIVLDGYPNTPMKGKIASLSEATGAKFSLLPPDNASGNFVKVTQRVPVKIEILDAAKYRSILKAGLSADVAVTIKK
ncbi:HlyD family secretion protein [Cytophagaceae bacterium YF14B1]|uniref:HlyD family secretion protein n=1 Tax=Xanthocytophaga flava TaxID=3048013 RepID=A0AAE3QPV3_9BACT|nr:HlyD family secretion protein [Xanthocytophaga flavus]MDJ1480533.1 HlyD family secretion protein [Xanthocytophaga flavus]